jgi:TorA maturation chaperone TorD
MIKDGHSLEQQSLFFDRHIASWFGTFFMDLGEAKSAVFYRSVARFGRAFFDFEKQYLAMGV